MNLTIDLTLFSEAVQLEAVKQYGYAIRHIHNPSEEIKLETVKQYGWAIQWIHNPSEEIKLETVKQNGWAIQYIEDPSEAVMQAALDQNENSKQYFKKDWTYRLIVANGILHMPNKTYSFNKFKISINNYKIPLKTLLNDY